MVSGQPTIRDARASLVESRKRLMDEVATIDKAIAALDAVLASSVGPTRTPAKRRSAVRAAVTSFLKGSRRVVHADEVVAALTAQGIALSSKDPKATVVTALLRMRDSNEVHALGENRYVWHEYREEAEQDATQTVEDADPAYPTQPEPLLVQ